jgi:hypothetical protein
MQLTIYQRTIRAVWADALFVSVVQRSDEPSGDQVRKAIAAAVRAYGDRGCAERVAQEFGDHPETAVSRMRWARAAVDEAFGRPEPARDGTRGRPELPVTGSRAWRLAS